MTHVDSGLTNCVRLCQKKEDRALLKPSQSPALQGGLLQCAVMGGRRGWLVEISRQALSLAYATLRLRHPGHPCTRATAACASRGPRSQAESHHSPLSLPIMPGWSKDALLLS